jgi:hypothetical protein
MRKKVFNLLSLLAIVAVIVFNVTLVTNADSAIHLKWKAINLVLASSGSSGSSGAPYVVDYFEVLNEGRGYRCECAAAICFQEECDLRVADFYEIYSDGSTVLVSSEVTNLGNCEPAGYECI